MGDRLKGKVALITGAASGMGAAQARLFAAEGAAVCVTDINDESGAIVVDDITSAGGRASYLHLDVVDAAEWAAVVAKVEADFGPISVLCHNAAANLRVGFDEMPEEWWHKIMEPALTGAFLGTKAVVPSMRRAGGGSIINMGSTASSRGGGNPAYAASKTGMIGMMRATAKSYAKDGIRCNMVSPASVDTPFIRDSKPHSPNDWSTSLDNPEVYKRRVAGIPLGRLLTAEDVAYAFLFLASDEASMISGTNLKVDGGATV